MKVKVLLFGIFNERADTSKIIVEDVKDKNELMQRIEREYPFFKKMNYLIAVNQEVIKDNIALRDGDEIALMPPFAGG